MTSILLVYEQSPESTTILLLNASHLDDAGITDAQIKDLHGTFNNTTSVTKAQQKVHDRLYEAIFGEYNDATGENDPARWKSQIIYDSAEDERDVESGPGLPPTIDAGKIIVVHTGIILHPVSHGNEREEAIQRIAQDLSNQVYAVTAHLYEEAEHADLIIGNGHHMAQKIAQDAVALLMERYRGRNGG